MSRRKQRESKRTRTFVYTRFNELKAGDIKVNIIGVITTAEAPSASSKKADYTRHFELVDESWTKLVCTMLESNRDSLPKIPSYGDILCLRKVAIQPFNGRLSIRTSATTTCLLFRKEEDFKPYTNFTPISLGPTEKGRVADLKAWVAKQEICERPAKQVELDSGLEGTSIALPSTPSQAITTTATTNTSNTSNISDTSNSGYASLSRPLKNRYYDTPVRKISEQVVGNREAAIMGLLKYFKPPTASTGKDHYTVLCLIDETQSSCGIACVIFNPHKLKLPVPVAPGDVVLIKGLCINTFQGNLQGRGHENSLVGIFPSEPMVPVPEMIGDWYSLNAGEKRRLQELRAWMAAEQALLLNSRLEELTCSNYCSTVCVVVRVSVNRHNTLFLSVCDGTKPRSTVADPGPLTTLTSSPSLERLYLEQSSTVLVATVFRPNVVAGDVVQLVNLCMVGGQGSDFVELVVRDNPHYPGVVHVLPAENKTVLKFRSSLPMPASPSAPVQRHLSTLIDCADSQHATLAALQAAPVGTVRVVEVQVMGLGKEVCPQLEDICQLRCSGCKSRYLTPHPQDPDFQQLLTAGDLCVCCSTDDVLEPHRLQFMYAFTLLVTDQHSQVEVAVSGDEGKRFFSELELQAVNLYVDAEARDSHLNTLKEMTGGVCDLFATSPAPLYHPPSLNLCIAVFISCTNKRMYKVVNTRLCR